MKNSDVALIQEPWTYKGTNKGLREVSGKTFIVDPLRTPEPAF
jgi:hypothetical protein